MHPAWPQHSGQLSPVVLLQELCKGKKQWDFPSHTLDWLQGPLGQSDVHHMVQTEQAKINQTGSQWLGAVLVYSGNLEPLLFQPGKKELVQSIREPSLVCSWHCTISAWSVCLSCHLTHHSTHDCRLVTRSCAGCKLG